MTQAIAKYAAKKMLEGEMNKYKSKAAESDYDPFYEMVPNPKKPSKLKKVKKQVPAYIPPHDADILAKARKRAYKLDFCLFNFMGFRFGWSSVVGIVPVIGDALDLMLSLKLVYLMKKVECGLPGWTLVMMVLNIAIDFLVGLVPFVGDLADAALKCNGKNVRLFEKHLDKVYKPKRLVEEDDNEEKRTGRRRRPATIYEDFSDEEQDRRDTFDDVHDNVRQPTRAYSGRRERQPDEEMGIPRHDTHRSHREERPSRNNTKSSRRH